MFTAPETVSCENCGRSYDEFNPPATPICEDCTEGERIREDADEAIADQTPVGESKSGPPGPGIYRGVPFDEYLGWEYISQSRLKCGRESMAHFRAAMDAPPASTDALRLGRFFHAGQLEPMTLPSIYCFMPVFQYDDANVTAAGLKSTSSRTAYCKAKKEEFERVNRGKEIITQSDYERLLGVVSAIAKNDRARQIFCPGAEQEISLVWDDDDTGLRCKARLDNVDFHNKRIGDLKKHDQERSFGYVIEKNGYHIQAAMYLDAVSAVTGESTAGWEYFIIAHTSTPPYICQAAPLSAEAIEIARVTYRRVLREIAIATRTNSWPGPPEPDMWTVPLYTN